MTSLLKGLFEEQGLIDDREPSVSFSIPGLEGEWGIFAPKFAPWSCLFLAAILQTAIQCVFAVLIYYFILPRHGTLEAYLIGWGLIIPIGLYFPFFLLEALESQNQPLNLSLSTVMTVVCFRCIEAMYGTSTPSYVTKSLSNYVAYYSAVVSFVWDPKTETRKRISMHQFLTNFADIVWAFTTASFVLSFLKNHDYRPFQPSTIQFERLDISWEVLSFPHIANAYLHAWLIYTTLKTGFELSAFNENIKGFETIQIFDSPFFSSRTPTEFWNDRWNQLTRSFLKPAVFQPIRKCLNTTAAIFCTFVVSGLYHDYVWYCIFYCHPDSGTSCHDHQFGRVTLFFAYVGLVMILERPVARLKPCQWLAQHLPTPLIAHLLLLLHLPLGFWYYGDWLVGGYFDHFAVALFQIKKM